ncbi:hypothetical protein CL176_02270 [Suicoccus acidiformans]|uniref:Uncharacterized protein n=1 Tax=Suicoccus acidiformans TaxID=2036206 RepID=A0A347WIN7_9LACT|nr:hypothetical protein [Suicoccus acidiformans]AXY24944.1 hypothetical protein CL176_02270 [Suicoccus acidiformans]
MSEELVIENWTEPEIGYVVEIPNSYTIIVRITKDISIHHGDYISIFEPGPLITDPKTDKNLGRFDFIKDTIQVVEIYNNFLVCQKQEKTKGNSLTMAITPLLQEKEYYTNVELPVDDSDNKEWQIKDSTIKILDPIKLA